MNDEDSSLLNSMFSTLTTCILQSRGDLVVHQRKFTNKRASKESMISQTKTRKHTTVSLKSATSSIQFKDDGHKKNVSISDMPSFPGSSSFGISSKSGE